MLGKPSRAYEEKIKKVEHIWRKSVKMEMCSNHERRLQYALYSFILGIYLIFKEKLTVKSVLGVILGITSLLIIRM